MKKSFIYTALLLLMLILPAAAGCTAAADTGTIAAVETAAASPATAITPTVESPEEPPVTVTATVTPPASDLPAADTAPVSGKATADTGMGQYIGAIVPIMERHNASREMYQDAVTAHGTAMAAITGSGSGIDYDDLQAEQTAYRDALLAVKTRIDGELADAGALEPPAEAAPFHAMLHAAIAAAGSALDKLIAYQDEVITAGAGDDTLFFNGAAGWDEATVLWWQQVWPAFTSLTGEP